MVFWVLSRVGDSIGYHSQQFHEPGLGVAAVLYYSLNMMGHQQYFFALFVQGGDSGSDLQGHLRFHLGYNLAGYSWALEVGAGLSGLKV